MYLRAYQLPDLAALFALDLTCFDPPFRFSRAAMRRFAEARNAIVRLACERAGDGQPEVLLGFCIMHLEPVGKALAGYIVTLDVVPEHRGRGVARTLMHALETAASHAGCRAMSLHVFSENAAAIRLYESLGYVFARPAKGFYGCGLDALIYWKSLQPAEEVSRASSAAEGGEWKSFGGSSEDAS